MHPRPINVVLAAVPSVVRLPYAPLVAIVIVLLEKAVVPFVPSNPAKFIRRLLVDAWFKGAVNVIVPVPPIRNKLPNVRVVTPGAVIVIAPVVTDQMAIFRRFGKLIDVIVDGTDTVKDDATTVSAGSDNVVIELPVAFNAPNVKTPLIVVKLAALNDDKVIPWTTNPHVDIKFGRLKAFIYVAEFPNPVPIVSVPVIVSNNGKDTDVHTENPESVTLP